MGFPTLEFLKGPEKNRQKNPAVAEGKEMKRKEKTIARGRAERLLWSDESNRALLASRFLGNRNLVSDMSEEEDTYEN